MNDFESLVALNMVPSIGSISIQRLLKAFSSPRAIFGASATRLASVEGMTQRKINAIKSTAEHIDLDTELRHARDHKISIITILDGEYPENLKNIYDPPVVLYVHGRLSVQDYNSVAIVGSRRATFYGLSVAQRLASELASLGITVVSGLARGIDTASHRGALKNKGRTIAVLGSGLLAIYPPENKTLAEEIASCGALISESSLYSPPLAKHFPRRNRIISGLSLGVVVVEAARNSGALITADLALQQSREVFAIPGKMDCATSAGANRLIKEGAILVSGVEDIIEEIKIKLRLPKVLDQNMHPVAEQKQIFDDCAESSFASRNNSLNSDERAESESLSSERSEPASVSITSEQTSHCGPGHVKEADVHANTIYAFLSDVPMHIDDIILNTHLDIKECAYAIMKLQLQHLIRELPGKNFVRAHDAAR